jgi:hypothetical protein
LLKLAILLFPVDVGLRRIYIDREEWLKLWRTIERKLLFWRGVPRPVEADESLAALLARRDSVRARQTGPPAETRADLFTPQQTVRVSDATVAAAPEVPTGATPAPEGGKTGDAPEAPTSTASRLLEAKRRAQRR